MPALIESFASLRAPAWHLFGNVFEDPKTTLEMIKAADLGDWDVRLVPVETDSRGGPELWEVVRTNPLDQETDRLGFVGERYKVLQNEEIFTALDNVTGGGRWETAGSIKGGSVVFGSQSLRDPYFIDPEGANDEIQEYVLASSSHDGSLALQLSMTPTRVVCWNTLNFALRTAKQYYKIRHTQSMDGKIAVAKAALGVANKYMDVFEAEAKELFEAEITKVKFEEIVKALYPEPEVTEARGTKAAKTRWDAKFERIVALYTGETNKTITGTAWGAVNALTEENQWYRNVRAGNVENALAAGAGFDLVTNQFRSKALQVVKAFA
jgi:phage/plasmid-like protein (TIGR03299 family)